MDPDQFLYRGVSEEIHGKGLALHPRGTSFDQVIVFGTGFKYGSGMKYGQSPGNAVIKHQVDSSRFPTSGVSTTPFMERARYYAVHGGRRARGYIYKIDRRLTKEAKIKEWRVKDFARIPQVSEDDEHILVGDDNGPLSNIIIIEIIQVQSA